MTDPRLLASLQYGWGNAWYQADTGFLCAALRAANEVTRPILELGSGLTTILLAPIAHGRRTTLWTLEHDAAWLSRVVDHVSDDLSASLRLTHAPLRDYGGFEWYGHIPEELPRRFGLIVCDGPPATVRGGRSGLLRVLGDRVREDTVVLLDDVNRPEEMTLARDLAEHCRLELRVDGNADRAYATLLQRA